MTNCAWIALLVALFCAAPAIGAAKVAILEIPRSVDITSEQAGYITDVVREKGLTELGPSYDIITRENLIVLLKASGKTLAECEGECEVETGRSIGADYVVNGRVVRFGKSLNVTLRLHSTHDGKLMSSAQSPRVGQIEDLPKAVAEACSRLFYRLTHTTEQGPGISRTSQTSPSSVGPKKARAGKPTLARESCPAGTTWDGSKCAPDVDTSFAAGKHLEDGRVWVADAQPSPPVTEPASSSAPSNLLVLGSVHADALIVYGASLERHLAECLFCDATYSGGTSGALLRYQQGSGYTSWSLSLPADLVSGVHRVGRITDHKLVHVTLAEGDRSLPARVFGSYYSVSGTVTVTSIDYRHGGHIDGAIDVVLEGGSDTPKIRATMRATFHADFPN